MLRAYLFLVNLIVLSVASPYRKYPFVFLLDIGNEEIQKTNAEQIRVSAPGGSLALRYPAAGEGETIAHVRVSGIDFGSDLKSNIVDGGPGYRYVVIMLTGNPGVQFDAVVTIDTIASGARLDNSVSGIASDVNINYSDATQPMENEFEENTIEEISSTSESQMFSSSSNAEQIQPSHNVYKYAQKAEFHNANDLSENEIFVKPEYHGYLQNNGDSSEKIDSDVDIPDKNNDDDDDDDDDETENDDDDDDDDDDYNDNDGSINEDKYQYNDSPKAEKYTVSDGIDNADYDNNDPVEFVDSNLYGKYKALKPHLYDNVKVYPQENVNSDQIIMQSNSSPEDPMEINQMFNDEEVHNDAEKYKDSNNNYFDAQDSNAVAS